MNLTEIFDLLSTIRLSELTDFSAQLNIHEIAQDPYLLGATAVLALICVIKGWKILLTLTFGLTVCAKIFTQYSYPGDTIYDLPADKLLLVGAVAALTLILFIHFSITKSR